jgi:glycosyltransferase involved in cell wall biosynthesis
MTKKNLFLLCDSYPGKTGEFFIDDEMRIISGNFETIYVLNQQIKQVDKNRFIPKNLVLINNFNITDRRFGLLFKPLFLKLLINEIYIVLLKYKLRLSFFLLKVILADLIYAFNKTEQLNKIIKDFGLVKNETIFYSYWHDKNAMALALLAKMDKNIKAISRAHRWDVYFEVNKFPYLPFKSFILNNLNQTFCISENAYKYFNYLYPKFIGKLSVSRLGKINDRNKLLKKNSDFYLFCSCSNLISVKRVDLIINFLSKLKLKNVQWIHFGDGPLRKELQEQCESLLKHVDYKLVGSVSNYEILEFYANNYVDLFINFSSSEGIPVSIMEAQSAGIPVIATNVGGNSEIVNNENGFIVEQDFNMDEVLNRVRAFLESSTVEIEVRRMAAFNNWKNNYSADKNYREFVEKILVNDQNKINI